MIPSTEIRRFVNRDLDSYLWVKKLSRDDLLDAVADLRPRPKLYPGLRTHQIACFLLGVSKPRFCFWLDMGSGKTLITLELLRYWYQCGQMRRALIFVTSDKAFPTWENNILRFGINVPYQSLAGSSVERWEQLDQFGDGLVLVPYPGAVALTSRRVQHRGKINLKLDLDLIARLGRRVDAVVQDESTRAAGATSLTHHLLERLTAGVGIRYALAGRPFGRDPAMLWAQHYLIDDGETLGTTLGLFRAAFFTSRINPHLPERLQRRSLNRQYTLQRSMEPVLARMIQHSSITYSIDECADVPPIVSTIEEVTFPTEAGAYYRRAVENIIASRKDMREVKNIFLRMRQLSSGFVGFKNDETGATAEIEFKDNPKFDRLMELLDTLPMDRKAVVFYEFTFSGRKIARALAKEGFNPIWIWSGNKDYERDLARFANDPSCSVAVVNNKIGAYSLDGMQVANYVFFYESPVGAIDREQAERRARRDGQTRKVLQYDLVVRGSMDAKILAYHKEAEDLMTALLRNPAGVVCK